MTYFPCLASVTIIYCVVVGQRSPATPPSILLAYDGPADDSGWKPSPVVGPVLMILGVKIACSKHCVAWLPCEAGAGAVGV